MAERGRSGREDTSEPGGARSWLAGRRPARLSRAQLWALPVVLALLIAAPGLLLLASSLLETRHDAHFVNVAGRQRMLASDLREGALLVSLGRDEDRPALRQRIAEFGESLERLEHGGEILGERLDPPSAEVKPELDAVAELWSRLGTDLEVVASRPVTDPSFAPAYRRFELGANDLQQAANQVVAAFGARVSRERDRALVALVVVVLGTVLAATAGVSLTRRIVVRRIRRLARTAARVGGGGIGSRVEPKPGDDLATLVRLFNGLAVEVDRLHAVELRYHDVVETASDAIVVIDRGGVIRAFNRAAEVMFGWSRGEVLGVSASVLAPLEQRAGHEQGFARYLARGTSAWSPKAKVVEGLRKDGSRFPIELVTNVSTIDGELMVTGVIRDVAARLRAEEALRRSEASVRALIECAPDAIVVTIDGCVSYLNPVVLRLLGYEDSRELIARKLTYFDVGPEAGSPQESSGETSKDNLPQERQWRRKDGTTLSVEVVSVAVTFDGRPACLMLGRDLTERKELAARLLQVERMNALGTLAAGLGHEINNPLVYVISNLDLVTVTLSELCAELGSTLPGQVPAGAGEVRPGAHLAARLAELQRLLAEAREGAARVRAIVRNLKAMSRAEEERVAPVALVPLLESAIQLASNEIRHRARLVRDYAPVPPVCANETRLGQVFLNLLINAAQAIPEGRAEQNQILVRVIPAGELLTAEPVDPAEGDRVDAQRSLGPALRPEWDRSA